MQKGLVMNDTIKYLKDEMGLFVTEFEWSGASDLPLYLAKAASYRLCSCNGVDFIMAEVEGEVSLPNLKRIVSQVSARAGLQVALVAQIDARQRKALVSQGIPFVVPGRQAFLPMLGFVASAKREPRSLPEVLAPGTQAVLVTLLANPEVRTSEELMRATGMPSSSISRALDDLSRKQVQKRPRSGHRTQHEQERSRQKCNRMPAESCRAGRVCEKRRANGAASACGGERAFAAQYAGSPPNRAARGIEEGLQRT